MGQQTCVNCGGPITSEHAEKYCSQACFREDHSFAGEDNPNYGNRKQVTECEICGSEFEYYPSEKEGLYCGRCVENESWREPPDPAEGPDNPLWNGGKVELTCPVCDTTFERYPSNVNDGANLCSDGCRAEWLSEAFDGENHPNWKGGGNDAYGSGWAAVRRNALERDGYECVICGASKAELGRNPDVHHIVPVRVFVESPNHTKEDAHSLDNVVSLCVECHRRADFGRIVEAELRSRIDDA